MDVDKNIDPNHFLICPNKFCTYSDDYLTSEEFWKNAVQEKDEYFNYKLEQMENRVRDVKRLLHEPHKLNSILYRLRGR